MTDYFKFGPVTDIKQLTQEQAVAFFGAPLYEAWRHSFGQSAPYEPTPVAIRVKSICRSKRTIEVELGTSLEEIPGP
jgi:hypothetical protein